MLLTTCLTFADMVLSLNTNIQTRCKILEYLSYPKNKIHISNMAQIFNTMFGDVFDFGRKIWFVAS